MLDICPLLMIAIKEPGFISDIEEKQARCLRGDCAWFVAFEDPEREECAIKAMAESLHSVSSKTNID
jgi:hypothetical protein